MALLLRKDSLLSRRDIVYGLLSSLVHLLGGYKNGGSALSRPTGTNRKGDGGSSDVVRQVDNDVYVVFTKGEIECLQGPTHVLNQLLYHRAPF